MKILNGFTQWDSLIREYGKDIDTTKNIAPINLNEANQIFLGAYHHGLRRDPQYEYKINPNIQTAKEKLRELCFPEGPVGDIYRSCQAYTLRQIEQVEAVGDASKFTELSVELYGVPDDALLEKALEILELPGDLPADAPSHDAGYLKAAIEAELSRRGYDWAVVLRESMSARASVSVSEKTVFIKAGERFTDADIKRLLVHEIGTHVVRAENGARQKYGIFRDGFPRYIETEEGLAAYNEERQDVLNERFLKIYAGRVYAVSLGMRSGFYDVFQKLTKYFNEDVALQITARVKRGLTDTARPGCFTKDFVYLNGYYKVKALMSPELEPVLYTGKIGLNDIPTVQHLIELGEVRDT